MGTVQIHRPDRHSLAHLVARLLIIVLCAGGRETPWGGQIGGLVACIVMAPWRLAGVWAADLGRISGRISVL